MAADQLNDAGVRNLARHRRRRRLVESPHTIVDAAVGDEREPLERQAGHLSVERATLARPEKSGMGKRVGRPRVVRRQGKPGLEVGEPTPLLTLWHVLEHVGRALEPSLGLGRSPEQQAIRDQFDRRPSRRTRIGPLAGEPVRGLVGAERERRIELVAACHPQPDQGFR